MKSCFFLFLLSICLSISVFARQNNPVANQAATVIAGNARFTILTPGVVRLEYAADGVFEDHATLTFINRNLPVPAFTRKEKGGWLELKTTEFTLRYKLNSGDFNAANLIIDYAANGKKQTWNISKPNSGNLKGTTRTLDGAVGNRYNNKDTIRLETGLISRDGWVM
ncbi:MAG: hypothetical protein Q8904_11290, partial [Bacteroidota bacterium]|nr:hypothetical protein [Bacteroidota bacterium]